MSKGSKYYRQGVQYTMEGSKYSIAVLLNSPFKTRGVWYSMVRESKYHGWGVQYTMGGGFNIS
jgi:hypothetical protein